MKSSIPYGLPSPPRSSNSRFARRLMLTALALLAGWRLLLVWIPAAEFAESSYQQNLLRIEGFQRRLPTTTAPVAVLAGTSVAGRLLPGYFDETTLSGIANLGLDGTSPAFALEILLRQSRVPRQVFLESYLLHKGPATNEHLIRASLESVAGPLALSDRLFQTDRRPTTLLYSALKRGREATVRGRTANNTAPYWTNAPAPGAIDRLTRAIQELRGRGSEVILVDIPVGADWPPGPNLGEPVASQLVAALSLRRLDCRAGLRARGFEPRFTDGIHLDSHSAREVAKVLANLAQP